TALSRFDPARPALVFTHTPPLDPLGLRNRGFLSPIAAARALSVLTNSSADALFVGHINDTATETIHDIDLYLTSVERAHESLWVEILDRRIHVDRRKVSGATSPN